MELKTFDSFYRKMFLQTNGYMLNWPIGSKVKLGDFFTIKPGKISVIGGIPDDILELNLGNLYDVEPLDVTVPSAEPENSDMDLLGSFPSPSSLWNLKHGCNSDYASNKMLQPYKSKVHPPDVNQFTTRFENRSDFFFSVKDVKISKILDFYPLRKRIIRRLATQFFNYSEVYLITEIANISQYSMGIGNEEKAEMVMSIDKFYGGDVLDLTSSDVSLTVEKVHDFSCLKIRENGGDIAFKAMKMSLSLKAKEEIVKKLCKSKNKDVKTYIANLVSQDLHALVPSIEINPSNAGEYFEWRTMSMEDLEFFLRG